MQSRAAPPDPRRVDADEGFDVRQYLHLLWGRKWLIVAVAALVTSASAAWSYRQTPIYRASTALIVDQQMPRVLGNVDEVVDISPHAYRDTADYMQTQVTVACSTQVARRAASSVNLHKLEAFWPEGVIERTLDNAADWLASMAGCSARRKASVIDIWVEHRDPRIAARLAEALGQAYMEHNLQYKAASTTGAVKWLAKQAGELKEELGKAEGELFKYRKKNDLVSMTLADRQNLISHQLAALAQRWDAARSDRIGIESEVEQFKSLDLDDPLSVPALPRLDSPVVRTLKVRAVEARAKYVQLRNRYLDKHPLVLAQKAQLEQALADLKREVRSLVAGARQKLEQVRATERKLAATLRQTKDEAFDVNKREIAYKRLERNAKGAERAYSLVLSRMTESDLSGKLRANNVRMLEPARIPRGPVRPRVRLNLMLGLALGLLLGVGLAFLLEALDNSVLGHEDVEGEGLVFLGALPMIGGVAAVDREAGVPDSRIRELVAQYQPRSQSAEECRAVRTNLLFASPDRPLRTLVFTSPGPGEGKTLTASNIAITMAQQDSRVLLIDADMRRPNVHRVFGLPQKDGLSTVLKGDREPAQVIKASGITNLSVMTAGPLPPNPAELCHSARLRDLLAGLEEQFDLVILDSPPVLAVTDPVVLSTIADGLVLVARSAQTARDALKQATRRLADVNARVLGCVVNAVDVKNNRYKYRYRYGRIAYGAYAYGAAQQRGGGPGDDDGGGSVA